jgi:hypothetical protein
MKIIAFLLKCIKITTVVTDSAFIHISLYFLQWDAPTKICFTFNWTNEFNYISYRPTGEKILTAKVMNKWTVISVSPVCINMVFKIQCVSSSVIFNMQKGVITILMGIGLRESCRESFKELKILTLLLQYIFSLLLFVHNRGYFASNTVYHNINTRQKNYLHLPQVSLTMYQKWVFYAGIKVFNALPMTIKDISSNPKKLH